MNYRFPHLSLLDRLRLDVRFERGRLRARARGPLGPLFSWAFNRFFDVYNAIGPVETVDGAQVYSLYVPPIPSRAHARHTEDFLRRWLLRQRVPLAVTIGVTDRCQCACRHCSAVGNGRSAALLSRAEIERAFTALYNYDFAAAHAILDTEARKRPADPLVPAVRGAALLFQEFERQHILELEFFEGDDELTDKKRLRPDAAVRRRLLETTGRARQLVARKITRVRAKLD